MPSRPRLLVVDVVAQVISMVPAPYLQPAVETFRIILSHVDQVQANKRQIQTIAETVAQILFALNSRPSEIWADDKWMWKSFHEFEELLSRIADFCAKHARKRFFRSFLEAAEVQAEINFMHTQLSLSVDSFQISSHVNMQIFHKRVETTRQEDQTEINVALKQLHNEQDKLLALVGQPNADSSSTPDTTLSGSHKTIFGLLGDIQDTVKSPTDNGSTSGILQEVLVELQKVSTTADKLPHVDPNPIAATLKAGLTADVLIAPLSWQMNVYMRNDQLTRHLYSEQIGTFAKGAEGSKLFVEYLMTTDDLSFQYSALNVFRKDKSVKHFFRPE